MSDIPTSDAAMAGDAAAKAALEKEEAEEAADIADAIQEAAAALVEAPAAERPSKKRKIKFRSCPAAVEYFGRIHHTNHPSICTCDT